MFWHFVYLCCHIYSRPTFKNISLSFQKQFLTNVTQTGVKPAFIRNYFQRWNNTWCLQLQDGKRVTQKKLPMVEHVTQCRSLTCFISFQVLDLWTANESNETRFPTTYSNLNDSGSMPNLNPACFAHRGLLSKHSHSFGTMKLFCIEE